MNEFSRRISKKSQISNNKNIFSLAKEFVECGRTDREMDKQDEAHSRLSLFC